MASLGDSADVRIDDFLDLLALDPGTRAILLQLEGVRDARRFMSAARAAARTRPVVVIRAGRYAAAGPDDDPAAGVAEALRDEAYEAAFRRAGMLRVRSVEGLFASAATLAHGAASRRSRLRSGRVAIVANGRGPALLAADALGRGGGRLARPSPETLHAIALALVEGSANPLDLGLEAGPDAFAAALPPFLRDPGCDAVLVLVAPAPTPPERYAAALAGLEGLAREGRRLLAAAFLGEATAADARRALAEAHVPAYATPEEAARALLDLVAFERRQQALREVPPAEPLEASPRREPVRALVRQALAAGRLELAPAELVRLLDAYELPPPGTGEGRGGVEVVLRMRLDDTFGPVLRVAQGGPGDALIGEAAAGLPPLNRALAEAMLEDMALGRLLLAGRRPPPARPRLPRRRAGPALAPGRRPPRGRLGRARAAPLARGRPGDAPRRGRAPARPGGRGPRRAPRHAPLPGRAGDGGRPARRRARPAAPDPSRGRPALQRAFRRMSPEDARLRLFGPARELPPELAARLTQTDYDREMAFVAEDPAAPEELIGGARVIMDADGRRAEFAVTVRSDHKRRGLGRIALAKALDHARSRGVRRSGAASWPRTAR